MLDQDNNVYLWGLVYWTNLNEKMRAKQKLNDSSPTYTNTNPHEKAYL